MGISRRSKKRFAVSGEAVHPVSTRTTAKDVGLGSTRTGAKALQYQDYRSTGRLTTRISAPDQMKKMNQQLNKKKGNPTKIMNKGNLY
mmetsp:Transcript_51322/g.92528  ORF Transcript_51322/g.92528 Transcript_51322/m.92528 type:complete len:88 (+) Transcript_51322:618-881(+)